jgi:hypothetical protein
LLSRLFKLELFGGIGKFDGACGSGEVGGDTKL